MSKIYIHIYIYIHTYIYIYTYILSYSHTCTFFLHPSQFHSFPTLNFSITVNAFKADNRVETPFPTSNERSRKLLYVFDEKLHLLHFSSLRNRPPKIRKINDVSVCLWFMFMLLVCLLLEGLVVVGLSVSLCCFKISSCILSINLRKYLYIVYIKCTI